ncbi:MAG: ATP-binding protein [Saprospiraceae bacterium]
MATPVKITLILKEVSATCQSVVFPLLLCILLIFRAQAQQQYFENPVVLKDAQVGEVADAVIDNAGFLWIGGPGGLKRYDGLQYKHFKHEPADSFSILSDRIDDLYFDEEQNQLWVATWQADKFGISIIDAATEQIKNVQFDPDGSAGLAGRDLNWIWKDRFGSYWISVWSKGLIKYLPEQDSFITIQYQTLAREAGLDLSGVNNWVCYSFDVLNDSFLWIGTNRGVLKLNVETHQIIRYPFIEGTSFGIRCLLHHSDNRIYVGTWHDGVYRFDPETERFTKVEMEDFYYSNDSYKSGILGLVAKSSSQLWVSTKAGIMEYDLVTNKIIPIKTNDYDKESYYGVYHVDPKNRALFWEFNDVYLFDPLRQQNRIYSRDKKFIKETKGFIVRRVIEEETAGKLWIAAQYSEGLYRLDLITEEWEVFLPPKSHSERFTEAQIWDILKTKGGDILVLLLDGVFKVSEKEKKLVPWEIQPKLEETGFRRLMEDTKGNIWVGSSSEGLFKIDPKTKTTRQFKGYFEDSDAPKFGVIKDLKEDRNGNIWICAHGYHVYDINKDSIYSFPHFLPDKKTYYQLYSLGIDGEGNVWIGSKDKGIGITDADHPEKGIVSYLDKGNGLKTNGAYRLLLDQKNNVWNLDGGLTKINPDRSATQYFSSNYYASTELWSMAQLANGNIVLGDRFGISIFDPDSLRVNEALAQPYILSFKVFDEERKLTLSPDQSTEIYLKPTENFFSMEFSALNPVFFGSTQFQYQLEGLDPYWVNSKDRRYVAYTNVAGGTYTFKLKAQNNEGVWNEKPFTLQIHVAILWYKRWWAYASYALLLLGSLYYWNRFRLNRRLEKAEAIRLQELDTFKTRFYANITHEFRTPLTVIEGMANELENNPDKTAKKNLSLIKKNSKNLLALINQMLDLSKLQAGKVHADWQQDDVILFIKYLVETHESFADLNKVSLQFYSEETELWTDFDAKKLEQIITNLISNAVKFTPEYGKVLVVAKKISKDGLPQLEIVVKDNGIGIASEQLPYIFDRFHQANPIHANQGTGIGLALVKELVTLMEGTIKVDSELNLGTTVVLQFPIQNRAPKRKTKVNHHFTNLNKTDQAPDLEDAISNHELPLLLIIEDNEDVTYYLKTCLEGQYQLLTSHNGKEGMEKAFESLPDIIISDVMMPEMDGFEVCKRLKEDERTNHIPIILLTAKATTEDKLEGLTQGADAYLIKPFEKEELLVRLNKLLEIRQKLQQKYSLGLISSQKAPDLRPTQADVFIQKVEQIVLANLDDDLFGIDNLTTELFLSRSQVHRKIKALTGMSTAIYIRHIRLQKAKELLLSTPLNVSEIAYQTGFKTPVYFSQVFKQAFGKAPSEVRK